MPDDREQGVTATLNYTVNRLNSAIQNVFLLAHKNRALRTATGDTWGIMNRVCQELKSGFMVMLTGEGEQRPHEAYYSVSTSLEVPLVNWDLSPILPSQIQSNNFEVSLKPPNSELIADLIVIKKWGSFIYLHDVENSDKASQNIQQIYTHLRTITNESISSEILQLPKLTTDFPEFLRLFNHRRFSHPTSSRVIIDASTAYRQQQLLQAIRSAQFNQINYHWVVANFDFHPYDVDMFQIGNINITGFQIINRESREYSLLLRHIEQSKFAEQTEGSVDLEARLAFVHDSLIVTKMALESSLKKNDSIFHSNFRHGELYNREYPGIYCHPSSDKDNPNRPFATFEHGRLIAKAMNTLKLTNSDDTLTGPVEFDRNGVRQNFFVTVIDLASNSKSAFNKKEFFFWKQGTGFLTNRTVAQHTRKTSATSDAGRKKVIKVVTVLVEPFVMIKRDCEHSNASECQGNERFEGYCIDLLKLLSDRIEDFNYEIFLSAGNKYGAKQPDGSWDGAVGYLLRGEADMAVASLTINQDRERVVDFSKPYMTTGISIMIKKPDKQEFSVFSFMQPLSSEIWMYIIFAYVGVSVVIFLVSRFSPYEWRVEEMANGGFTISNDFSVYNCLWFTLAAFMQQGTDILPRSISGRIASSAWWFFTMIIVSSYTANLAAFLTLEKMQAPIESVEDLAKQTKIKYGIQQGGSTAQFFKYSSVQIYQRMWRFMESQVPSVFTSSYAEGIERVRSHKGRYAFLLEATANEYANTRKPCDTMKVGANLNSVGYGVATPFGSQWKDLVNLAILALQEKGELKKLENKWWYDRGQCDGGISDGSSASLNLSKVAGIFYILMGGMIASMIAALGEFLYRSRIEARKGQINSMKNLRASFCGQLKLSLQGGAVAKEGSSAHEALKRHKAASLLPANYHSEPTAGPNVASQQDKNLLFSPSAPMKRNNILKKDAKESSNASTKPPIPQQKSAKPYNTMV
ncbi:ligand-gated ion channel domain-containing protein [Ditylenchus destructor]|uniref:Glutamate receptor 1 n=1 Tax=Ditylenchus destructor TaxID=166010 RepID=A0AAD4N6V8_9BILA|nr:ligand-gated ion channel domain-containing protein [Ditylenchus destructor]